MADSQYQADRVTLLGKSMSIIQQMKYVSEFEFPYLDDYKNYEKITKIGQGTFGEVWKAKNKVTNQVVAMKKIFTENEPQGFPITAMREISILKRVRNENIVKIKNVVTDHVYKENQVQCIHYLIFEFCEHDLAGLLSERRLKFRLAEIKSLMKQLLLGLHYLHRNKMLHRDMKSSNVLVNKEGVLKLADFGLSRPFSDKRPKLLTNRVVTLWYRPPELLLGDRLYTPKIDMWGAGCIMAEMWTRTPIMKGNSEQTQLTFITKLCGSINTDVWPSVQKLDLFSKVKLEQGRTRKVIESLQPVVTNAMACDLLDKLLVVDPTKRLDADSALDHDFFFSDPMPLNMNEIKETFSKINVSLFQLFTNRRPNVQQHRAAQPQQQQQPQQRPHQQHHHQHQHQQHQHQHHQHQQQQHHHHHHQHRATHRFNMAF